MKKKIFQNWKLEINFFKHMFFSLNTIYFLRNVNKFDKGQLNFLNELNSNIAYFAYKDSRVSKEDGNPALNSNFFYEKQLLFLIDFKDVPTEELLLFLKRYYADKNKQKAPVIIINKPKKSIRDKKISKNSRYLYIIYYLILKYGTRKKIFITKQTETEYKNNKWSAFGFSFFNLLSFVLMALFGLTTPYVKMSALLESMTYFMNNQPKNSRIHAVYHEYFESFEERTANNARNKYSNLQRETTSYGLGGTFNSYFISGTAETFTEFNVNFVGYENVNYSFKTKVINQSVYSNQNSILMEKIDLEQYLIKRYAHHSPLPGAEAVYYMPSNIADEIIDISNNDDFETYSDLIGKLIVFSYEKDDIFFEQTMSINNIFYTSNVMANIGGATNENEYVNAYSGKDNNLGKQILDNIGNFGVSTSTKTHKYFGSTFCLEFFGYNKSLKMMLDRNFAEDLKNGRNYFEYFYLNKPISNYGINLNEINEFYRNSQNVLFGANYLFLFLSILFLCVGTYFLIFYFRMYQNTFFRSKKMISLYSILIFNPFVISQLLFVGLNILLKNSTKSIGLLNVIGSTFSLIVTIFFILYLYIHFKGFRTNVFKIKI